MTTRMSKARTGPRVDGAKRAASMGSIASTRADSGG
jgi:hypothetical protein